MLKLNWKAIVPILVGGLLLLTPTPDGLAPYAWHFFAIFVAAIIALMFEPLPGAAIGLIVVTLIAIFPKWLLFSPEQLAKPGFKPASAALNWALGGFVNSTVWLIFGAFMFALGYEKTGLGRRIALILVKRLGKRTLTLGYAVVIADLLLAPFTPSNTARSGGTVYPVIRNLPPLYGSLPNDPSARKMGSYLMWTALAATCVTSSLFLTALAPNLLALELASKQAHVTVTWGQWFTSFAPVGFILLALVPLLGYVLYPPEIKQGDEVPAWASKELSAMGPLTRNEVVLAILVLVALGLWVFGGALMDATTAALVVICLMLMTGVVSWNDIQSNKAAWNTLAWFATLVALADGLNKTGFVNWLAGLLSTHMHGFSGTSAILILCVIFFLSHYLFASVTAHVTAMLPVMLAVGQSTPGVAMPQLTLFLLCSLGIMGIITPYGTGPSPLYYGSGYLPSKDFWRLGGIFGLIYLVVYLVVGGLWIL